MASRSDETRPRPEGGFRFAGPGHNPSFRCAMCCQPMPNYGRRQVKVRGVKVWIGRCCLAKKDAK